jgi:hypothetical protein
VLNKYQRGQKASDPEKPVLSLTLSSSSSQTFQNGYLTY